MIDTLMECTKRLKAFWAEQPKGIPGFQEVEWSTLSFGTYPAVEVFVRFEDGWGEWVEVPAWLAAEAKRLLGRS